MDIDIPMSSPNHIVEDRNVDTPMCAPNVVTDDATRVSPGNVALEVDVNTFTSPPRVFSTDTSTGTVDPE